MVDRLVAALLRRRISDAIEARNVPTLLARRNAFQLVFKVDVAGLGDRATWDAIGQRSRSCCSKTERETRVQRRSRGG